MTDDAPLILHHGGVDDYAAFVLLCRPVYVAARAGAVDCTAAFDLAVARLEVSPLDPDATELALLSLECAEASQPRMAEVALRLVATAWDPGFMEEPGWLAALEDAMRLVNRDVAATGIRHPCQLRVRDEQDGGNAYVLTWGGYNSATAGISPAHGADPVSALLAVADDAQDALMEELWAAWPVCPVHRLGVHVRYHDKAAAWWCAGDDGHPVAAVGEWPAVLRDNGGEPWRLHRNPRNPSAPLQSCDYFLTYGTFVSAL